MFPSFNSDPFELCCYEQIYERFERVREESKKICVILRNLIRESYSHEISILPDSQKLISTISRFFQLAKVSSHESFFPSTLFHNERLNMSSFIRLPHSKSYQLEELIDSPILQSTQGPAKRDLMNLAKEKDWKEEKIFLINMLKLDM